MDQLTLAPTTQALELPEPIYRTLLLLADRRKVTPAQLIEQLIGEEERRRERVRIWNELVESVHRTGHPLIGKTTEEIVEHMRKTRAEIWEAEYAHLYR